MTVKEQLVKDLHSIVKKLGGDFTPVVEFPADLGHGDFTTNAALVLGKTLKRDPMEVAEIISSKFKVQSSKFKIIEKIEVVRPGFVNFWFSGGYLNTELERLKKVDFFSNNKNQKGRVVVEYSSPNIAKPFTIGHLRSTIIGDAIANLLQATGWEVYRDNHLGDWGTQFGKQIYAIKEWGDEKKLDESEHPVKMLVELYVRFHAETAASNAVRKENEVDAMSNVANIEDEARKWFKRLEEGDIEAKRLWQKCVDWSWREFDAIYKQLGVSFTENEGRGYGESFFEDKMESVVEELEQKKLLKESEGAKLVFFPGDKYSPLMIIKKDGATLYATRDLATDKFRLDKYGKDILVINEAGAEQSLYFQQLFAVEEMLGWFKKTKRVHIKHGLYRFKDEKMSTRKGSVIWLKDVLYAANHQALQLMSNKFEFDIDDKVNVKKKDNKHVILERKEAVDNASVVGIGALKWNDLKRDSKQDITFDWREALNMEGNSGPYLQYTYARTQSVLRKSEIRISKYETNSKFKIQNSKLEQEELLLLRSLVRFEEVVLEAAEKYAPNILCNYLFVLAQAFNLFYQKLPILTPIKSGMKEIGEIRDMRLALTEGTGKVIKLGLELLGIEAPTRM